MLAERSAASLRDSPCSLVSSADFSSAGRSGRITSLPSPGGGGSTRLKGAAGWGDSLSLQTVPEWRDHPTPSRISLRSCSPTLPLQGRVRKLTPRADRESSPLH